MLMNAIYLYEYGRVYVYIVRPFPLHTPNITFIIEAHWLDTVHTVCVWNVHIIHIFLALTVIMNSVTAQ